MSSSSSIAVASAVSTIDSPATSVCMGSWEPLRAAALAASLPGLRQGCCLCIMPGGGLRCTIKGCGNGARGSTRFCSKHGGPRCTIDVCGEDSRGRTGFCIKVLAQCIRVHSRQAARELHSPTVCSASDACRGASLRTAAAVERQSDTASH
jgi:hypothetical protein